MMAAKRRWPLGVACGLWALLYAWMLLQSGSPFGGRSLLAAGTPDGSVLSRFGASIPDRVMDESAWWRIGTSLWLHQSLLGVLITLWIAWSVGSQLLMRIGAARTTVVALLGGVTGAALHAYWHADAVTPHAHGFLVVVAMLGGLLAWGIRAGPEGKAVRRSSMVTLLIFAFLHWAFTRDMPDTEEARAYSDPWPMVVAAGSGALLTFLFPNRSGASSIAQGLAVLTVLSMGACLAIQAPVMAAAGAQSRAEDFFDDLTSCESLALSIWKGRSKDVDELKRRIDRLPHHKFLVHEDTKEVLTTYLRRMSPIVYGTTPDPDGVRVRLQRAHKQWMDAFESKTRASVGLRPRPPHQWYWKRAGE